MMKLKLARYGLLLIAVFCLLCFFKPRQVFAESTIVDQRFELRFDLLKKPLNVQGETSQKIDENADQSTEDETQLKFHQYTHFAVHPNGGIVFSDQQNHVIYYVDVSGKKSVLAGQYNKKGWKDGDYAQSLLNLPRGLVFDQNKNLYVFDAENYVIRKITPTGVVSTLAGQPGKSGYQDGLKQGVLFFDDIVSMRVDHSKSAVNLVSIFSDKYGNDKPIYERKLMFSGVVQTLANSEVLQLVQLIREHHQEVYERLSESMLAITFNQEGKPFLLFAGYLYFSDQQQLIRSPILDVSFDAPSRLTNAPKVEENNDSLDLEPIKKISKKSKQSKKMSKHARQSIKKNKQSTHQKINPPDETQEENSEITENQESYELGKNVLAWNDAQNVLFILDQRKQRVLAYSLATKQTALVIDHIPKTTVAILFFDGYLHLVAENGQVLRYKKPL